METADARSGGSSGRQQLPKSAFRLDLRIGTPVALRPVKMDHAQFMDGLNGLLALLFGLAGLALARR